MVPEKQKCIAEQSIYGDLQLFEKIEYTDHDCTTRVKINECFEPTIIDGGEYYESGDDFDLFGTFNPILRPLSWLTREITHEGYNDNQPFVPLIELAKKIHPEYKFEINNKGDKVIHYTSDHPYSDFIEIGFDKCLTYCYQVSGDFGYNAHYENIENITECYDLLNLWHFNYRNLPDTDFVSTEEVGDVYAVKTE